ncbi:response regulator [Butyrivibrio sp. X503]|uniref:response regulator n=1 Tax=Butyrivibrio sp. X503 TaxID=2364878 RepID=UPI000EA8B522|nr:response regulator [Butyrivibrio sp. X503]RKM55472.1 response regulator [Butyrivibrio sp. X503]
MQKKRIMVIGEKETFLVKVLVQKINESGMIGVFEPFDVNAIGMDWEGTDLVTIYMNDGDRPDEKVLRFLIDKLTDEDKMMIPIGEKNDIVFIQKSVPLELIYKSMLRPIDNVEYIMTVKEQFNKAEQGEFKKTILVVDDDPSYLNLVREWLKDKYKVSMASSGLQAIKWLGKNKADLILLDHEMPVTSGPQVLEMLRSDTDTKNIPVIFLTGKSDKDSVMSVVSLKPEGYLLKTIDRRELLDKLEEFFILSR